MSSGKPLSFRDLDDPDDLRRVADVVRVLPHAPFDEPAFKAMSSRPMPGEGDAALSP